MEHAHASSRDGLYDDMMRSLEDALPPRERRTTIRNVHFVPTRPVGFDPIALPRLGDEPGEDIMQVHTQLLARQAGPQGHVVITEAPVAMPSRYVDFDADVDLNQNLESTRRPQGRRARSRPLAGLFIGAALGLMIALGGYAYSTPEARTSAVTAASNARTRVSTWVSDLKSKNTHDAQGSHATAAPPPAAAPIAPPVAAPMTTVTTATTAAHVPEMRAPAPPAPLRRGE